MMPSIPALFAFVGSFVRSRAALQVEIVALRHQVAVYQQSIRRPRIRSTDRVFWARLARYWTRWREVLVVVRPATVVAWQRRRFRDRWVRLRGKTPGRPAASRELRDLIRAISVANPRWGSPRIVGELRKPGIAVAKSTVQKYRVRPRRPASPCWRAFLKNPMSELVARDFVTVPTVTFRVLFVLIVLAHDRRRILYFNVTVHPTAQWTAQQLVEAFPWQAVPRYLLRNRDAVYGQAFDRRFAGWGLTQVLTAPRSPWQNPYTERVIGSIRRECLDHVVVFNEDHLRRLVSRYVDYCHRWRTHLSLDMDTPHHRPVQLPEPGAIIAFPEVGGLHHHYERRAV